MDEAGGHNAPWNKPIHRGMNPVWFHLEEASRAVTLLLEAESGTVVARGWEEEEEEEVASC